MNIFMAILAGILAVMIFGSLALTKEERAKALTWDRGGKTLPLSTRSLLLFGLFLAISSAGALIEAAGIVHQSRLVDILRASFCLLLALSFAFDLWKARKNEPTGRP